MSEVGHVPSVMIVDKSGDPIVTASAASTPDEFSYSRHTGIVKPPYAPSRLLELSDSHAAHGAALDQRAADTIGNGWRWDSEKKSEQGDVLESWFRKLTSLSVDETVADVFNRAVLDMETFGWGVIELSRDRAGNLKQIFGVNAHSLRFLKGGETMVQGKRQTRKHFPAWKPAGAKPISFKTGLPVKEDDADRAHEMFVIRRPSRRSELYGSPSYISAIGWLVLAQAARDDNITFFENRREPRWMVVLENIDNSEELERALQKAFKQDLREPHHNIFVPVKGGGKIHFQRMTDDSKDLSFERLQERVNVNVLLAHRIPPDRIGLTRVGPLGGNVADVSQQIYKSAVVGPLQRSLAHRVRRLIAAESPLDKVEVEWTPIELDVTDANSDQQRALEAFRENTITLDEARGRMGLDPVGKPFGGMFRFQLEGGASGEADAELAKRLKELDT